MRNWKILATLVLLALGTALALGGCGTTASGSGSATDTVTAIGTGTGSAAPDTAQFSLGVTFTAKDVPGAIANSKRKGTGPMLGR